MYCSYSLQFTPILYLQKSYCVFFDINQIACVFNIKSCNFLQLLKKYRSMHTHKC